METKMSKKDIRKHCSDYRYARWLTYYLAKKTTKRKHKKLDDDE